VVFFNEEDQYTKLQVLGTNELLFLDSSEKLSLQLFFAMNTSSESSAQTMENSEVEIDIYTTHDL